MLTKTRSLAICGAPLVGKRQILNRLAKAADCPHLSEEEQYSGERILRLRIVREELGRSRRATLASRELPVEELEVRLASGHMFFKDQVIRTVLSDDVAMICYVVATEEAGPGWEFQEPYFRSYMDVLRENSLTWDDVPWIWILNKVDFGSTNPLEPEIPEGRRPEVIHTVAVEGTGVDILWNRIVEGLL